MISYAVKRGLLLGLYFIGTISCSLEEPSEEKALPNAYLNETSASSPISLIFIVPGWGYSYLPKIQKDMELYAQWYQDHGLPRTHVYILDYPFNEDIAPIETALNDQITKILKKYKPNAKFDMLGHSLGAFTGLYTVLRSPHLSQLRKFISLAGAQNGSNSLHCKTGICGKTIQNYLVPYQSDFLKKFYDHYKNEMATFDKCALYSQDDYVMYPYNAGQFPNGTNVEVEHMKHLDVFERPFFMKMLKSCYNNNLQVDH